jgi:hypothetical protein
VVPRDHDIYALPHCLFLRGGERVDRGVREEEKEERGEEI